MSNTKTQISAEAGVQVSFKVKQLDAADSRSAAQGRRQIAALRALAAGSERK